MRTNGRRARKKEVKRMSVKETKIITGATVYEAKSNALIRRVQMLPENIGRGKPIGIDYVSGSRMNTYFRCEATYMFRYVRGKRDPGNSSQMFGKQLHIAQETFLRKIIEAKRKQESLDFSAVTDQAVKNALKYEIDDREFEWKDTYKGSKRKERRSTLDASIEAGTRMMAEYWSERNPRSAEQGYLIEWHDQTVPPYLGYVDFIEDVGDHDEAVDLKTGSALTELALQLNDTMSAYAIMNEITTGRPTTTIRYDNFVRNKVPVFKTVSARIDPKSTERLFRRTKDFATRVETGMYMPKNTADVCGTCKFFTPCREEFSKNEELGMTAEIPWTMGQVDENS